MAARRRNNTRDTSSSVETASSIAEAEERDPNEIISADDALKRAEAMDALAKEAEDPMAALLAADEAETAAHAAPPCS